MAELIYALTILYAMFVVDAVIGDNIILFIKDVFHLDLSTYHGQYRQLVDNISNTMNTESVAKT